eukprot:14733456-Ditylum_brightwellii.AAC.1
MEDEHLTDSNKEQDGMQGYQIGFQMTYMEEIFVQQPVLQQCFEKQNANILLEKSLARKIELNIRK